MNNCENRQGWGVGGETKATIARGTGRRKKTFGKIFNAMAQQHTTDGHRDLETESAQWANAVKKTEQVSRIYFVFTRPSLARTALKTPWPLKSVYFLNLCSSKTLNNCFCLTVKTRPGNLVTPDPNSNPPIPISISINFNLKQSKKI